MLSVWTLKNVKDAVGYFEKDNYYTKDGGYADSSWWGQGAARLKLQGEVNPKEFEKVLAGHLPNGAIIPGKVNGKARRPGTDLTFSAPKSVSIEALVRGRKDVLEAHNKAVSEALQYAEDNNTCTMGKVGRKSVLVPSDNMLVARFNHDTARVVEEEGADPQLHTHCVVTNVTQRQDKKWMASPNEMLLRNKMLLGATYRAALARELMLLGYEIVVTHIDGRFEIKGYLEKHLEFFSKRSQQIKNHMKEFGMSGARAASFAALKTRSVKKDVDRSEVIKQWVKDAKEIGAFFVESLSKLGPKRFIAPELVAKKALRQAMEHVFERKSVARREEILAVGVQRCVGKADRSHATKAFDDLTQSKELVSLKSGYFASPDALKREKENIALMLQGKGQYEAICTRKALQAVIGSRTLTAGQNDAVSLLSCKDQVFGVQGYAGTGKTYMLSAVSEACDSAGYEVKGMAISSSAANVIEQETGIKSQTLKSFLIERRKFQPQKNESPKKALWIIDEASMVGTKDANTFLKAAARARARVMIVGDAKQLGSVEAGSPFALFQKEGMHVATMDEILRQKDKNLKEVVLDSMGGKVEEALKKLDGNIIQFRDPVERTKKLVDTYLSASRKEREGIRVLTGTNREKTYLDQAIRQGLKDRHEIDQSGFVGTTLKRKDLTEDARKRIVSYEDGDVVRFGREYRKAGIKMHQYLEVASTNQDTGHVYFKGQEDMKWKPSIGAKVEVYKQTESKEVVVGDEIKITRNDKTNQLDNNQVLKVLKIDENGLAELRTDKRKVTVDLSTQRHWDYAYTSTVHGAQGTTCEKVLIHASTENKHLFGQESFYVATSRAQYEAKLFVDDASKLPAMFKQSQAQKNAVEFER